MIRKSGITLLETVVVTAIIAILALIGFYNVNNFRKEAEIDNVASQLLSDIRVARSKSLNGELLEDEIPQDFDQDLNGLPKYGIEIYNEGYKLIREYKKPDESMQSGALIENIKINHGYSLSPTESFYFERVTGNTGERTVLIEEKNGTRGREIHISPDSIITITKK